MNFHDNKEAEEYFQNCKSKSAKVLGFIWVSANEIIYVTDQGVELYQVCICQCLYWFLSVSFCDSDPFYQIGKVCKYGV